ncbi:hypothetical protein [Candidatus Enterovibrio altilux]|uniref:hypothetical protein n=1 Tax=Candidatus Enterovibrio altilux TaxID=1927128 RepID=UPI0037428F66
MLNYRCHVFIFYALASDDAYDIKQCYKIIRIKQAVPLIPSRQETIFGVRDYLCNLAVSYQKLYGSHKHCKMSLRNYHA